METTEKTEITVSQAVTKHLRGVAEKLLPILTNAEKDQQALAKKQGALIWPYLLDVAREAVKGAQHAAGEGQPVSMVLAKAYFVAYCKELEYAVRLKFCAGDKKEAADCSMSEIFGAWGNYKTKATASFESYPKGKDNEAGEAIDPNEYKGAAAAAEYQRDVEALYKNRPKAGREGSSGQGAQKYTALVRAQLEAMHKMLDGISSENLDSRALPLLVSLNGQLAGIMASQAAPNSQPITDAGRKGSEVNAPQRAAA